MLYIYEDALTSQSDVQDVSTSNVGAWKISTNSVGFYSDRCRAVTQILVE